MRIPILTYHSLNTRGTDYQDNDHVALAVDLDLLKRLGYVPCPLSVIVRQYLCGRLDRLPERPCALTFDDGVTHDFVDFQHPRRGLVKSFATILREAADDSLGWRAPRATSFVIASPEAREVLDRTCIAGRDQWHDRWWLEAARSRVLEFGNHSWDHNHRNLDSVAQRNQEKGNFHVIDTWEDASAQILDAERYLHRMLGRYNKCLFAYPYGHVNAFLRDEFFPAQADRFRAAFTTAGDFLTPDSRRWSIPRFVCGEHWNKPEELAALLGAGGGASRISVRSAPLFRRARARVARGLARLRPAR